MKSSLVTLNILSWEMVLYALITLLTQGARRYLFGELLEKWGTLPGASRFSLRKVLREKLEKLGKKQTSRKDEKNTLISKEIGIEGGKILVETSWMKETIDSPSPAEKNIIVSSRYLE